jgi:hypothetical protein
MLRGERSELLAPAVEERIGGDQQRAGIFMDKALERRVDFGLGAGGEHDRMHSDTDGYLLRFSGL